MFSVKKSANRDQLFYEEKGNQPFRGELFNIEQLKSYARRLASRQQVTEGARNPYLLNRLNYNDGVLQEFNNKTLALQKPYYISPATEWLIDNFYLIEEHIQLARRHFPKSYSRELPCLAGGPYERLPRVYEMAAEFVSHVDAQIDEESLKEFFRAYQTEAVLKLGELWAVPIMLRLVLIENLQRIATRLQQNQEDRDLADKWVDRLEEVISSKTSRIVEVISDMAKADIPLSSSFVAEFSKRLASRHTSLKIVKNWIEERLAEEGLSSEELIHADSQQQAADQLSVSHSIKSLRFLNSTDWRDFVEDLSIVEQTLRQDPAGIYPEMDFATRDHYRHVVESLAPWSSYSEAEIAREAIELTKQSQQQKKTDRECHVGYYLIDSGISKLKDSIQVRKKLSSFPKKIVKKYPFAFYSGSVIILTILATLSFMWIMSSPRLPFTDWRLILLSVLFLVCVSQLAVFIVNWLSTLISKPHVLPRIDFSKGITPSNKTMVVVPTLISDEESVDKLLGDIEIHYLSNRDSNLFFALLTDLSDSLHETDESDSFLVERCRYGIEQLNRKYAPADSCLFYLFHRPRKWNPKEEKWMGYERKRGKLTALNHLILKNDRSSFSVIEGNPDCIKEVKYIITLDADTQLPPETAYKMVGTMAHPLNKPVFDSKKNIVIKGYGIVQPRVSISLTSSLSSRFARLFTDDAGIDPYTRSVSDVYQDLFHEGSFIGKGIYDVEAFERALEGRFPENKILSHDLIESAYARSALATDIEIYENYPSGYILDAKRRHRWVRGDWQLLKWVSGRVPTLHERSVKNPISRLNKWKIADNLRRSLVPPATLLFVTGFCILFPEYVWAALVLWIGIVIVPFIFNVITNIFRKSKDQSWSLHFREVMKKSGHQLIQTLFSFVTLPYDAWLNSTAILTTIWRLAVSKKRLLQWQTAAEVDRSSRNSLPDYFKKMWFAPFFAVVSILFAALFEPVVLYALPLLLVWMISPYIAWRISQPLQTKSPSLHRDHYILMHRIARKTWFFFEKFVTERENWLPPDNFQEVPDPVIASRTSPTNIGLSLLAALSANDLGYLSVGGMIERINQTFRTITAMRKYRGHLYNWYDTRTLEPLYPMYISTVDSGNLAGHLLTLGEGLREAAGKPVYSKEMFEGLLDTVRVLRYMAPKKNAWEELEKECSREIPETIDDAYRLLKTIRSSANRMMDLLTAEEEELREWCEILLSNCDDHLNEIQYLAPWVELLDRKSLSSIDEDTSGNCTLYILPLMEMVLRNPTLEEIVDREEKDLSYTDILISHLREQGQNVYIPYFEEWKSAIRTAAERARKRLRILEVLSIESESLAKMDFGFLYDPVKKLFVIGFNVEEQRPDQGYYDLLASESRLSSYVAIALGQIPQEHWFSLGRLLVLPQGKPVLLSWSGSMFEYLMPILVMPNFEETLLDQTYKGVVQEQVEYARKFNVPWGISESGYNRTDAQFNYQYQAFGIPKLGLKRGLSKDLVIAPYATLLALMVAPRKACENMQRLTREGHEGVYGYYEAIDYTPSHLPLNEQNIEVRSFMAHHQGMGLLALDNVLKDNPMPRRFLSCRMLKAFELLLQERIPHSVTANVISDDSKFEIEGLHPLLPDKLKIYRTYNHIHTKPEVNLLSNGRYQVMINHSGSGYSRWNHLAVTRWREDPTSDAKGLFIYLRDQETGEYWSDTHQPTLKSVKNYEAKFSQAYAEYRHRHEGIDVCTNICVSPEDDIELRCITLTNHSHKTRTIEITTFSEVVISPQDADESHMVFNNLFVQTRFDPSVSTIFCTRRARSEEEKPPFMIHLMLAEPGKENEISFETDRTRFVGRGNSLAHPYAMQNAGPLSGSEGSVLDPVVSLRRSVTIPPGKKVSVCTALGMAETWEGAHALAEKYQNRRMTDRAFELAWTHSQVVLYQLNISESEAQLFAKMAGALVYMEPQYRADPAILKNNRKGQNGLWGYSISGDLPLVLVRVSEAGGIELVRQMILAHAYWRMKGLMVELVIVNEDTSVYRHPLHDEIISLVTTGVEAPLLDKPGGIFVRSLEHVPGEDLLLLQSVARIVIHDREGTLVEQLKKNKIKDSRMPALQVSRLPADKNVYALPPRDLMFENGFGGFTRDGREYVITHYPGHPTPAPWCNVIANPNFGTVVSESGSAYTWAENAHEFRLTPWNNDPVQDSSGEALYLRDEQTGNYWSPTPWPAGGKTPYVVRHGFGYTVFEHSEYGIDSELWIYVATDAPVKFSVLKLYNRSGRPRRISVTGYYEWVLADRRSKSLLHVQTEVDIKTSALYARNFYNTDFPGKIAFVDAGKYRTLTGDRKEFIGYNKNLERPAAMENNRLSGKTGAGFDPCGAVQVILDMRDGEQKETTFLLGYAHHKEDMHHLIFRFRQPGEVRAALEKVWEYWNRTLGTVNLDTPDPSVNVMSNGWMLYQALSSRIWGRSGFYQSGGAYGFRDQLQDVMALVHAEPAVMRQQILLAARHQFVKGDVQHWWHPPTNRGVRTHFSDDYLWLPYVTYRYVKMVNDTGILDEEIPFLEGRELRPEEESYYDMPLRSDETATLYEHCVRSIRYGLKFGVHGLPLIGSGDWNDGMNLVGKDGKGESVWLAFFLYDVLMRFSEIADSRGDDSFASYCREEAHRLKGNIESNAWDGEWYRRAYFDNGQPLGSASNEECRIDSIPQSWSVISGAGEPERSQKGMEHVDLHLVDRQAKMIRLFTPPFDKSDLDPGYIKGYIPGVRENGGQYTHAAVWAVQAYALMGDSEKAWELFDMINPVEHASSFEAISVYKVEPYVIAADVYANPQHLGRGGWTWYTGSAALFYMLLVETLLGVTRYGDRLTLSPLMRKRWNSYKVHYRYYDTVYHITIQRITDGKPQRLLVDGNLQPETDSFVMCDDRIEHFVELWMV